MDLPRGELAPTASPGQARPRAGLRLPRRRILAFTGAVAEAILDSDSPSSLHVRLAPIATQRAEKVAAIGIPWWNRAIPGVAIATRDVTIPYGRFGNGEVRQQDDDGKAECSEHEF